MKYQGIQAAIVTANETFASQVIYGFLFQRSAVFIGPNGFTLAAARSEVFAPVSQRELIEGLL